MSFPIVSRLATRGTTLASLSVIRPCSYKADVGKYKVNELEKVLQESSSKFKLTERAKRNIAYLAGPNEVLSKFWWNLILQRPEISNTYGKSLSEMIGTFKKMQFPQDHAYEFMKRIPTEMLEDIHGWLSNAWKWKSFCSNKKIDWKGALMEEPRILTVPPSLWHQRQQELMELFTKEISEKIISSTPSVLFEDREELFKKVKFILKKMNVSPQDIVKFSVLRYDLDFLLRRYEFLNRAGLYKHPNPKTLGEHAKALPPIEQVTLEDDVEFLSQACKGLFTLVEYNTFLTVLEDERNSEDFLQVNDAYADDHTSELAREMEELKKNFR